MAKKPVQSVEPEEDVVDVDAPLVPAGDDPVDFVDETEQGAEQLADDEEETPDVPDADEEDAEEGGEEELFSPELLSAAGLTAEEAEASFGTPEALESAVRMMDRRFYQAGQLAGQQGFAGQAAPAPPVAAAQPTEDDSFEFPKTSDGQEWDDDTKLLFKAFSKKYEAELEKRDAALAALWQEKQDQSLRQYVQEFDGFVNGLGDEYKAFLGNGTRETLPGIAKQNRIHLDSVAATYAAGRRAHGQPDLTLHELLARSLPIAFPEVQAKAAKREVLSQVEQRQRMQTQRPSHRRTSKLTGDERAIRNANAFLAKRGVDVPRENFDYSSF